MSNATRISLHGPAMPFLRSVETREEQASTAPEHLQALRALVIEGDTAPRWDGVARAVRFVESNETIAPLDQLAKTNREMAAIGCIAVDRLRGVQAAESTPLSLALMRARWWLETFSAFFAVHRLPMMRPHVSVSPEDEVVLEWWNGERKLTIYASREGLHYVRVWGPDIVDEMEDAPLDSGEKAVSVWRWLVERAS